MLLCVAMAIYLVMSAGQRIAQIIQLNESQGRLTREVRLLDAEFTRLKADRDRLYSTTDIERVAREELNLIKPGETAVIVIAAPNASASKPTPPSGMPVQEPPWRQWWRWLFGN